MLIFGQDNLQPFQADLPRERIGRQRQQTRTVRSNPAGKARLMAQGIENQVADDRPVSGAGKPVPGPPVFQGMLNRAMAGLDLFENLNCRR